MVSFKKAVNPKPTALYNGYEVVKLEFFANIILHHPKSKNAYSYTNKIAFYYMI